MVRRITLFGLEVVSSRSRTSLRTVRRSTMSMTSPLLTLPLISLPVTASQHLLIVSTIELLILISVSVERGASATQTTTNALILLFEMRLVSACMIVLVVKSVTLFTITIPTADNLL